MQTWQLTAWDWDTRSRWTVCQFPLHFYKIRLLHSPPWQPSYRISFCTYHLIDRDFNFQSNFVLFSQLSVHVRKKAELSLAVGHARAPSGTVEQNSEGRAGNPFKMSYNLEEIVKVRRGRDMASGQLRTCQSVSILCWKRDASATWRRHSQWPTFMKRLELSCRKSGNDQKPMEIWLKS